MNKPFISVVVTSYNYEDYIKETLASIATQDYDNFEVIIVDDGSKDNSLAVIKEYTEKYANFHLYQHEDGVNKGLIETVKLAVSKANGEYIDFCESDDYWMPNHLSVKAEYMRRHPDIAIVVNDFELVGSDYEAHTYAKNVTRLKKFNGRKMFNCFRRGNTIPTFSVTAVKKEVLAGCDFNSPIPACLDLWLWRQIAKDHKIGFVDVKLSCFRRHEGSYIQKTKDDFERHCDFIKASNDLIFSDNLFCKWGMNLRNEIFRFKKRYRI